MAFVTFIYWCNSLRHYIMKPHIRKTIIIVYVFSFILATVFYLKNFDLNQNVAQNVLEQLKIKVSRTKRDEAAFEIKNETLHNVTVASKGTLALKVENNVTQSSLENSTFFTVETNHTKLNYSTKTTDNTIDLISHNQNATSAFPMVTNTISQIAKNRTNIPFSTTQIDGQLSVNNTTFETLNYDSESNINMSSTTNANFVTTKSVEITSKTASTHVLQTVIRNNASIAKNTSSTFAVNSTNIETTTLPVYTSKNVKGNISSSQFENIATTRAPSTPTKLTTSTTERTSIVSTSTGTSNLPYRQIISSTTTPLAWLSTEPIKKAETTIEPKSINYPKETISQTQSTTKVQEITSPPTTTDIHQRGSTFAQLDSKESLVSLFFELPYQNESLSVLNHSLDHINFLVCHFLCNKYCDAFDAVTKLRREVVIVNQQAILSYFATPYSFCPNGTVVSKNSIIRILFDRQFRETLNELIPSTPLAAIYSSHNLVYVENKSIVVSPKNEVNPSSFHLFLFSVMFVIFQVFAVLINLYFFYRLLKMRKVQNGIGSVSRFVTQSLRLRRLAKWFNDIQQQQQDGDSPASGPNNNLDGRRIPKVYAQAEPESISLQMIPENSVRNSKMSVEVEVRPDANGKAAEIDANAYSNWVTPVGANESQSIKIYKSANGEETYF